MTPRIMSGMTEGDDLTAKELAAQYLDEQRGPETREENPLFRWERWISEDPERAWPVFVEIVALRSDDETLYQVSHRLRLLLW